MLEILMSIVVIASLAVFAFGLLRRIVRFVALCRKHGPSVGPRSPTPYPIRKRSWLASIWMAHVGPWKHWYRSDPLGFAAHMAYHLGLYVAVMTYALGLAKFFLGAFAPSPWHVLQAACGWATESRSPAIACRIFQAATVLAVIGLSIPKIRRWTKAKAFRPPDPIVASLGLSPMPKPKGGRLSAERRYLGNVVLIADLALAVSFFLPEAASLLIRTGHAAFVVALLAIFPFTFLFHEIWVAVPGTMSVLRYRDGGV